MAGIQSMITKHTKSSKIIQPIMGGGGGQPTETEQNPQDDRIRKQRH